jgi:Spy/CpxP family protein refolding chaperone
MKSLILVITAIVLLTLVNPADGFAQPKQKFFGKHHKGNVIEKLNLTEEQEEKISSLRAAHQKETIDLRANLEKKMVDKRELKRNSNLTRSELISTVEEINNIKNQIAIAKANHRMDVFELLNDEQKKIWQEHEPMRDHMKMKLKEKRMNRQD